MGTSGRKEPMGSVEGVHLLSKDLGINAGEFIWGRILESGVAGWGRCSGRGNPTGPNIEEVERQS